MAVATPVTASGQPHPPIEVNAAAWASPTQIAAVGNSGATAVSSDGGVSYTRVGGTLPVSNYNRLRAGGTADTAFVVGPNGALALTPTAARRGRPARSRAAAT